MQIFIFLVCTLCGAASGIVYDIFYIARVFICGADGSAYTLKDKIFTAVCDILYFAVLTASFLFCSYLFDFYELRLYMLVATAAGALIYLKSFHIILAICIKKAYNKIRINKNRGNLSQ
ncbi:MAG: spore cortex biosynthesis protein YabQ [Candidatus Coproplasma sp.]